MKKSDSGEGGLSVANMQSAVNSPSTWISQSSSPSPTVRSPLLTTPSSGGSDSEADLPFDRPPTVGNVANNPVVAAYLQAEGARVRYAAAAKNAAAEKKRLAPEAAATLMQAGVQKLPLQDGAISTFIPKPSKSKVTAAALRTAVQRGLATHFSIPLNESSALIQSFEATIEQPKRVAGTSQPTVHRSYKRKLHEMQKSSPSPSPSPSRYAGKRLQKQVLTAIDNYVAASPRLGGGIATGTATGITIDRPVMRPQFTWAATQAALARLQPHSHQVQTPCSPYLKPITIPIVIPNSPTIEKSEVGAAAIQSILTKTTPAPAVRPIIAPSVLMSGFQRPEPPRSVANPWPNMQLRPLPLPSPPPPPPSSPPVSPSPNHPNSPGSPTVAGCEIGAAALASLRH
jgi:hypothetical protein